MSGAKIAALVALVGFVALIGWGLMTGAPLDLGAFTADPWVIVGLGDLYIGFILIAVVIYIVEPVKWKAMCWIIPLFVIGNGLSALWLLLNVDKIRNRFATE